MEQSEYSPGLPELPPNPHNMHSLITFMLKHSRWDLIRMAEMLEISAHDLLAVYSGRQELTKQQATLLSKYFQLFITG